jgi:outer membrane cobalamin receptor
MKNDLKLTSNCIPPILLSLVLAAAPVHWAYAASDLEELMQVVETSVNKKEQALRMAPGVQVFTLGNNKLAESILGQADRFSNKLLVTTDGGNVYNPLFSGLWWKVLELPLENSTRIEVIREPGAAVRGANAVNGVINIIPNSPFNNLGGKVSLATGSGLRGYALARQILQIFLDSTGNTVCQTEQAVSEIRSLQVDFA